MLLKFKTLPKIKHIFTSSKSEVRVGAVVYRTVRGYLEILLSQNKQGYWHIPQVAIDHQTDLVQSLTHTLENISGVADWRILQTLGVLDLKQSKLNLILHIFLVQALTDSASATINHESESSIWLKAEEAMQLLAQPDIRHMLHFAITKIKRAQI